MGVDVEPQQREPLKPRLSACSGGAGDGTRTRDSLLGKQVLYQLSYPREADSVYACSEASSTSPQCQNCCQWFIRVDVQSTRSLYSVTSTP